MDGVHRANVVAWAKRDHRGIAFLIHKHRVAGSPAAWSKTHHVSLDSRIKFVSYVESKAMPISANTKYRWFCRFVFHKPTFPPAKCTSILTHKAAFWVWNLRWRSLSQNLKKPKQLKVMISDCYLVYVVNFRKDNNNQKRKNPVCSKISVLGVFRNICLRTVSEIILCWKRWCA